MDLLNGFGEDRAGFDELLVAIFGELPQLIEPLTGGNSSTVYMVQLADGDFKVLKFAEGADWLRAEGFFLEAWAAIGIQTPKIDQHGAIPDSSLAYLVMAYMPGKNLFPLMEAEAVPCNEIEQDLGQILARMHGVVGRGYGRVQCDADGRPYGESASLADTLIDAEWQEILATNLANGDLLPDELLLVTRAAEMLDEQMQGSASFAHNDFRAGNILYDPTQPQPYTIIDPSPELTHPYLCLAYTLILTEIHGRIEPLHFRSGYAEITPIDSDALDAALFLRALTLLPRWGASGAQYAIPLRQLFKRQKHVVELRYA